jgi:mono/diheme cytochrome c family protein
VVIKDPELHHLIEKRSTRPALLGALLIGAGGVAWYLFLPESAKAVMASAAVLNIFMGLIFVLTLVVFLFLYLGPFRNPGWMSPGFAGALFVFGLAAFSIGEFVREAVRKPYIVYNVVLGNQIFPSEVPQLQRSGYLEGGIWTKAYMVEYYPQVIDNNGRIDRNRLSELPPADQIAVGHVLFQYHCNDCHAAKQGYSAAAPLVRGWTPEMIQSMTMRLHEHHFFMPHWAGTQEEAELLSVYLASIAPPRPTGMVLPTAAAGRERTRETN